MKSDESVGLRERQQQARRQTMRDAARELFVEQGYVTTTVEMIAERAFVSPPTVYNYFGTKAGLLLSIIAEADKLTVTRSENSIGNPTGSAEDEITNLLALMVKESLRAVDAKTWQHAYTMTIIDADNTVGAGYGKLNRRLYDIVEELLAALVAQGKVADSIDIPVMRGLLERLNHALFSELISDGGVTFHRYRRVILPKYVRIIIGQYT